MGVYMCHLAQLVFWCTHECCTPEAPAAGARVLLGMCCIHACVGVQRVWCQSSWGHLV